MSEDETIEKALEWGHEAGTEAFQKLVLVVVGMLFAGGLGLTGSEIGRIFSIDVALSQAELLGGVVFVGMGAGRYWGKILALRGLKKDFFYGGIFSTLMYFAWIYAPDLSLIPALFTSGIIAMHMSHAVDDQLKNYGILFEKMSKTGLVLLGAWIYVYPVLVKYFPFLTRYVPAF
jgi:hypothetical protein